VLVRLARLPRSAGCARSAILTRPAVLPTPVARLVTIAARAAIASLVQLGRRRDAVLLVALAFRLLRRAHRRRRLRREPRFILEELPLGPRERAVPAASPAAAAPPAAPSVSAIETLVGLARGGDAFHQVADVPRDDVVRLAVLDGRRTRRSGGSGGRR